MLEESSEQLVAHLSHPNGWWRDTAQMLIVTRGDKSAVPALLKAAQEAGDVQTRIHALWCMEGLKALPDDLLLASLKHAHPRVRRAAVQLTEPRLKQAEMAEALHGMLSDSDPAVRIQLYLAYRGSRQTIPPTLMDQANPILAALQRQEQDEAQLSLLGESAKKGRQIYETLCSSCHGAEGDGVKQGEKMLAPALSKNPLFKTNRIDLLAKVLLKGESGPIAGVTYGEGFMPPWEAAYKDDQMASVLNYIGERWHGWRKPIATEEKIASVRKQFADKTTPWTSEEIHAALRKP